MSDDERLLEFIKLSTKDREYNSKANAIDRSHLNKFLNELLTYKEREKITMRLKAMCLIYDCAPYAEISNITGLSSATIAKLSKRAVRENGAFKDMAVDFNNNYK